MTNQPEVEAIFPLKANFNPIIRTYLLLYVAFVLLAPIIGIVLILIWLPGVGQWWSHHYFDKLDCESSERSLCFQKGIFVQFEKTVPLGNIQDVTVAALFQSLHFEV